MLLRPSPSKSQSIAHTVTCLAVAPIALLPCHIKVHVIFLRQHDAKSATVSSRRERAHLIHLAEIFRTHGKRQIQQQTAGRHSWYRKIQPPVTGGLPCDSRAIEVAARRVSRHRPTKIV